MEFLNRFMRGMQQRRVRSDVLSQTAQETGKRGFFPEFGMGEAARGLLGWDLDEADKNDPVFQENLQNRVDSIVPSTNPFQGTLGADDKGVEYKFPDTKQNRTGEYVDKTPSNTTESIEQTKVDVEKGQKAVALAEARKAWLQDTANSPAAKSGAFTDDERWQTHLNNQEWRRDKGRSYTHGDFLD